MDTSGTEPTVQGKEVIDLTLSDSEDDDQDRSDVDQETSTISSQGSEIEIVLDEATRSQLQAAISKVSETRLRRLLHSLVETDANVEAALARELVTLTKHDQEVVPRWEQCARCGEEFDMRTRRREDECHIHPGDLEVIEDAFADWDERCHGPQDTEENRIEYPENFEWSCCDKPADAEGCVPGAHIPGQTRKKRRLEE